MAGGTPKKRKPRGRSNQRRSHLQLVIPPAVACLQCKTLIPPHTACPTCGTYRGRTVIDVASREEKRAAKEKERKRHAAEEGRS